MSFDHDRIPIQHVVQLLEQASATTGFTPADIAALIECELDTEQLLEYITAVLSNRMN